MSFARTYRQKIVDEFLNATGSNAFRPREFLAWLKPQNDHRAWKIFFEKDDDEAANEWRLDIVRKFVSGLKIMVRVDELPGVSQTVNVEVASFPAYFSPQAGRAAGGGYQTTDVSDPASMRELARQAAISLRGWLSRYDGLAIALNVDLGPVRQIAKTMMAAGIEIIPQAAE